MLAAGRRLEEERAKGEALRRELESVRRENERLEAERGGLQGELEQTQARLAKAKTSKAPSPKLRNRISELEAELQSQRGFAKDLEKELKQMTRKKSNVSKTLKGAEARLARSEERLVEALKCASKITKTLLLGRQSSLRAIKKRLEVG